MSLPAEFPKLAIQQVAAFVTKKDPDVGRVALAAYELLGYGLYLKFGNTKYMMQGFGEMLTKFSEEDFKKIVADLPKYMEAASKGLEMHQAGVPLWLILIKLAVQYGPEVVAILGKLFNK